MYLAVTLVKDSEAPLASVGVQAPSSYELSNWLVIPAAGVLAVKLTPLAAVPWIRLPVDRVTLPVKVIGVAIWLALMTEVVVFSMAIPSCKQIQ